MRRKLLCDVDMLEYRPVVNWYEGGFLEGGEERSGVGGWRRRFEA